MPALEIFHESSKQYISALRAATLYISKWELLPDVLEIFGEEKYRKFLNVFGGRVIRVPEIKEVTGVLRDIAIWAALSHTNEEEKARREALLVAQYGLARSKLRDIHAAVDDAMAGLGLSLGMGQQDG